MRLKKLKLSRSGWLLLLVVLVGAGGWFSVVRAPSHFPRTATVSVESGLVLSEIAAHLASEQVIRSPLAFKVLARLISRDQVVAGDYFFYQPENLLTVVRRLVAGRYDLNLIKVTVPEGLSNVEVANLLEVKLDQFNRDEFLQLAAALEGYLFPDTYFFSPQATPRRVIRLMNENFHQRLAAYQEQIESSPRSLE